MRFSIIIPAYNAADHIEKALQSIASQTFTDYELIVVCDSCRDNTAEIAEKYGARVYREAFHNDGLSRNEGIDVAKGEYILFMDDDDWWLHECVLEQLDKKLRMLGSVDVLAFSFIIKDVGYAQPLRAGNKLWIAVWNKCWRRECIGNTRFPNVYSCSDQYFHEAMMKKPLKIQTWDMPMYYYNYLRKGSISERAGNTVRGAKRWLNT